MSEQPGTWKEKRRGFKHELIVTLRDQGFSQREAAKVVNAILDAIKGSLLRGENVEVEDFGRFFVEEREKKRAYRFGKVISIGGRKIDFKMDYDALDRAYDPDWQPHASWAEAEKRTPKLRGKKLQDSNRQQEELRRQTLRAQYVRTIVRFFGDQLHCEDWGQFWVLRWQSHCYEGTAGHVRETADRLHPIEEAGQLILETAPTFLNSDRGTRSVELVCWYARWTARLDVDPKLWNEAEREANERLRASYLWAPIYAGTADR